MLVYCFFLLSGAALVLGFAPFHFFPIALLSPICLCFITPQKSLKQHFLNGLSFGTGLMLCGVYWIYICVHQYGHAPIIISLLVLLLFVLVNASIFGLLQLVYQWLSRFSTRFLSQLFIFPCCFALFDYIHSHILSGFPWLLLGYTQITSPLKWLIPIIGVYGMTFVVALMAGAITCLFTQRKISSKVFCGVIFFIPILTGIMLKNKTWTQSHGQPIKVALLQGNIDQSTKWNPQYAIATLNNYINLIKQNSQSQLIILPEGAFPVWNTNIQPLLGQLQLQAVENRNTLLIGLPYQTSDNKIYNAMLMLGAHRGTYFKRQLVPFGEYIPYYGLFQPLLKWANFGRFGYDHGPINQPLLPFQKIKIAPFICYEIAYSQEILNHVTGSGLIVVISDDSWYGRSIALNQQLEITQMRALETGRPVLAVNSTGITAVISPIGTIIQSLPIDTKGTLKAKIYPVTGNTPLMLLGYWPLVVVIFGLLFCCFLLPILTKNNND